MDGRVGTFPMADIDFVTYVRNVYIVHREGESDVRGTSVFDFRKSQTCLCTAVILLERNCVAEFTGWDLFWRMFGLFVL